MFLRKLFSRNNGTKSIATNNIRNALLRGKDMVPLNKGVYVNSIRMPRQILIREEGRFPPLKNNLQIIGSRRYYSCEQKPDLEEIRRGMLTINNNIIVVNHHMQICMCFSVINIWISIFC